MKKIFLTLSLLAGAAYGYSQSTAGLIAHWNMNGTANDVSGNGHNGHIHNVIDTVGETGMSNTAYYFNGVNSYISIPPDPGFNLTQYSICAKVKVEGFNSSLCQGNTIFERGVMASHTPGSYGLAFDDNQADSNCSAYNPSQDIFFGGDPLVPSYALSAYYTPTIVPDQWYSVVVTLNDTVFKTYVNGVLKVTYPVTSPGGFTGTSSDSASIGANYNGVTAGIYEYYFKGMIDDIVLYNRVLTDSEVIVYSDSVTCGPIALQPTDTIVNLGSNGKLFVSTTMSSPVYQWQEEGGSGFVNLINVPPYSGVTTDTLTFTSAPMSLDGTKYRCLISNSFCADTSNVAVLTIHNTTAESNLIYGNAISVFPNPANNTATVYISNNYKASAIEITNELGQVLSEQHINSTVCNLDLSKLSSGIYFIKIQIDGQAFYKKLLKN